MGIVEGIEIGMLGGARRVREAGIMLKLAGFAGPYDDLGLMRRKSLVDPQCCNMCDANRIFLFIVVTVVMGTAAMKTGRYSSYLVTKAGTVESSCLFRQSTQNLVMSGIWGYLPSISRVIPSLGYRN